MDQRETPYADAMRAYATTHPTRFHLPGHGGAGDSLGDYFGERMLSLDLMPMMHGIDMGAAPTPLERSLQLAAEAWGARRSWFLGNGASQGNQIAALAIAGLRPGGRMLVQRSVHSSVIDALVLTGGSAGFVAPVVVDGMAHGLVAAEVAAAIAAAGGDAGDAADFADSASSADAADGADGADAADAGVGAHTAAGAGAAVGADSGPLACVYVVSPSYFGFVSDIAALADVAHAAGLPLVVDEAWGAHLGFHPSLPQNALRQGADLVISSTHKLGGSLTQSAMLHLGHGPLAAELEQHIDRARSVLQSTSESNLLLASLDLARCRLATGAAQIGEALKIAESLRARVRSGGRFGITSDGFAGVPGFGGVDPLRIPIDTRIGGINGHRARTILAEEHGILVEMATDAGIVALFAASAAPSIDGLVAALHALPVDPPVRRESRMPPLPLWGAARMTVRDAFFAPNEIVSAEDAVGRVAADSLAAYPPGIPNIMPGEEITRGLVDFVQAVAAAEFGHVRGAVDAGVRRMRVVAR